MDLIDNLKWRYATKKYDTDKKVSAEHIEQLKEVVQLSASSYGLQPYKIVMVEATDLRQKLLPVSWGQTPVTDASHLFVFCNRTEVNEEFIADFVKFKGEKTGVEKEKLAHYSNLVKSKLGEKSTEEIKNWTAKQTYIALSNALNACAELKIDATPIEGFEPEKYDSILGLERENLTTAVVLAIGYRHADDYNQKLPKVRRPISELFEVR